MAQAQEDYAALLGDDGAGAWEGPPEDEGLASAAPDSGAGRLRGAGRGLGEVGAEDDFEELLRQQEEFAEEEDEAAAAAAAAAGGGFEEEEGDEEGPMEEEGGFDDLARSEGRSRGPDLVRRREGEQVWRAKYGKIP